MWPRRRRGRSSIVNSAISADSWLTTPLLLEKTPRGAPRRQDAPTALGSLSFADGPSVLDQVHVEREHIFGGDHRLEDVVGGVGAAIYVFGRDGGSETKSGTAEITGTFPPDALPHASGRPASSP